MHKKRRYSSKFKKSRPEVDTEVYQKWRKSILKRDDYKCVVCGKKACIVHHLDGWSWCIARRYDVSNGVVLCNSKTTRKSKHAKPRRVEGCHDRFHRLFGRGQNTVGQFEMFLQSYGKTLKDIL